MRKIFSVLCLIFFLIFAISKTTQQAYSDELDDISKKIAELSSALSSSQRATAPFETELVQMKKELDAITLQVNGVEQDIANKKVVIAKGYEDLSKQQVIFNRAIRNYYIKNYLFSPFLIFISADDAQDATRLIAYQRKGAQDDKDMITNTALKIVDLEERKAKLEDEEKRLRSINESLAGKKAEVQKLVDGAKSYQATLSSQIAELSAKQQAILSQRLSSLNIPLFAYNTQGGCSSDIGKSPGFGGAMGFFTYGVPNRVGLNQYGAWGRAKAGQSYDQILHAYYNFDSIENRSATINVEGYGSYSLDDYVKRVYEVPDSWTDNDSAALKAQTIAARSYALAYTNNGAGSICTTQQCQVFKPEPKGGNWEQAVNATAGLVMVKNGNPIKAWFSSTHGGYMHSSGDIGWNGTDWTKNALDTTGSVSSFSDLKNNAYDKDSPWFYCDWGSRKEYNGTAWLKEEEVADIANVILLARKDASAKPHLYQVDKPNPEGTDTWDANKIRQELGSQAISSASDVSINADFGSGKTSSVNISGQNFPGDEFKNWFNLRAPGNIQIVGPLYNIEKQ